MSTVVLARPEPNLRSALRLGGILGLWITAVLAVVQTVALTPASQYGVDARAYWLTGHHHSLYGVAPGTLNAYLYSPLFAQVIHPLTALPFGVFYAVLVAVDLACVAWLLAPLGWRWAVPLVLLGSSEFVLGNVTGLIAVAIVAGVTGRAGALSVGWLTKVVPGVLGLTWLASRGEWAQARRSVLVTGAVTAVSFALWPSAWLDWATFLQHSGSGGTAHLRALLAVVLVAVGARRGWWWVLPVALLLGAPVPNLYNLTYLAALPRMRRAT